MNKIVIGTQSFRKLVTESILFADKSLLIREFLELKNEVLLITSPRRWGKSMNMDMIRTFLEIQSYNGTHPENNADLFKNLKINAHKEILDKFQGKYPVISIDFKDIKDHNLSDILEKIKDKVLNLYSQHSYLSKCLNEENNLFTFTEKEKLKRFLSGNITKSDIQDSLRFLSQVLSKYFDKKVFILIDEYDAPINKCFIRMNAEDLEDVIELFRGIMGAALKNNEYLEKGLITGVFRIAKSSLFSDLNNIVEYTFLNNAFAEYYGFTQDEVDYLLDSTDISEDQKQRAKNWYNGYKVASKPDLQIYNPWAIVNFVNTGIIGNYWEESGSIDFIKELFKKDIIRNKVEDLLYHKEIDVDLQSLKFSKQDFIVLKEVLSLDDTYVIRPDACDLFFAYIFAAGYLTVNIQSHNYITTKVRLPNQEVASELGKKLLSYYTKKYLISKSILNSITDCLISLFDSEDTDNLKVALGELFAALPEFVDIVGTQKGVHGNEDLVHSLINCTLLQIHGLCKFGTEVPAGMGRTDSIICYQGKGMIVELKYNKNAQDALNQIRDKEYTSYFKDRGVSEVVLVGINVDQNKNVSIVRSADVI